MNRFTNITPFVRRLQICAAVFIFLTCAASASKAQTTFTASGANVPITINALGPAAPYPSTINVSGLTGSINKITVNINGLTHTDSDEIDIMLVNPSQTLAVVLMSDNGATTNLSGVNLTFDDAAANSVPTVAFGTGTYKPTNTGAGDIFAGAVPTTATIVSLSEMIASDPNGTWRLYVVDDQTGDAGTITGWSLTITTGTAGIGGAITINDNTTATPYPSTVNFVGLPGTISRVTVRLNNFTHSYPDDVGVLLVSPTGVKVRLMTDVGGATDLTDVDLTYETGATAFPDNTALTTTAYSPTLGTAAASASNLHPANFAAPAPAAPYVTTLASFNGVSANGTWSLYVDDDTAGDAGTIAGWTLSIVTTAAPPTAARTNIGGYVLTGKGSGISRAQVTLTGTGIPQPRTVSTNQFGYYSFADLEVGGFYILSVGHRKYSFENPTQVVQLFELTELNFTANPEE